MTKPLSPHRLLNRLPPLAVSALIVFQSCTALPMSAPVPTARRPAAVAQPTIRRPQAARPDPRYRPPINFKELQSVAGEVAKASGRKIRWRLELGADPGPLARISGGMDDCIIRLHPVAARQVPPNTWAFIIGHEFAHRVENLGEHGDTNPANELKADIAGARYAMAAGYRLEAFLGWVLAEPNQTSNSHGSLHGRVWAIATHFGIPENVLQAQAKRYANDRAAH